MRSRRSDRAAAAGFLAPFLLLFTAFFALPIGYAVYQSLLAVERIGPLGLGGSRTVFAGLSNYRAALTDDAFLDSITRVLLYAVVQVPLMIGLATILALLLDAAAARGVPFFRSAYFLPYGVPGVIASILWGFLYVPGVSPIIDLLDAAGLTVNLLDSGSVLWSIANIVTWEFAGYNMLVIVAQLKAINSELYEAARIDGADAWQVIRHVKLPLIRPAIVLTTVFTIIGTLQLFAEPLVLRPTSTAINTSYTPNLAAYTQAFVNNNYSLAAAQSVILAVAACVLSFGFLRLVGRREDDR
ncbi:carbohydrate ABC transporter permease [Micromonospora sp. HM5-17]|jgi:multiple sugar transport system permease protein|uniref:carbohydrate ABC transporter permease n=1 Tax=Micromonospora sp. HM5-17 TaxID=2487710 RepID=UPI000F475C2D|nr:sugar ABC transporter permease [Micromonospora sp. HM5-17]ROT27172.1 sugar ABC transporter permease [Micromonospora sp. HM5-17]